LPVILTLNMKLQELFCPQRCVCGQNIFIGLAVFQIDIEVSTVYDQDSEMYNALVYYLFIYGQN